MRKVTRFNVIISLLQSVYKVTIIEYSNFGTYTIISRLRARIRNYRGANVGI
jgi:hypothetical protein